MSIFGDRLKELREEKELLSKDFAKLMNVEPATVTNWEKGNRFPREDMLITLADFFNVTLDYLLGRAINRNGKIYKTELNGNKYELEIKNPYDLSPDEVKKLIEKLENYNFNVHKVINEIKNEK